MVNHEGLLSLLNHHHSGLGAWRPVEPGLIFDIESMARTIDHHLYYEGLRPADACHEGEENGEKCGIDRFGDAARLSRF